MICETFDIKNENSQEYARLNTYLISHSDSIKTETRPLIILCPGGGYWFTSEREGEMLALQFVAAGFHLVSEEVLVSCLNQKQIILT